MTYPLQSPGTLVTVTDESFYSTGGPGTRPLFIIGTQNYKVLPSDSTQIAPGTDPANANQLYLITSQRDLIQTFGNPIFFTSNGNPLHGYELNEYGLHAAYEYLGIANTAYIIRANVDYGQLRPSPSEPTGEPVNGTYWLNTSTTKWGLFLSNGSPVLGNAWNSISPSAFDSWTEVEQRIIGTVGFTDTSAILGLPSGYSGNLDINSASITVTDTMTLADVITAINSAGITNVTAITMRLLEKSYLLLRDADPKGAFEVQTTSDPTILTALGLTSPGNVEVAPSSTLGNDRDLGVLPLYANNPVYQKIVSEGIATSADPNSSGFWFNVGSTAWLQATPTRVIGLNAPSAITTAQSFNLSVDNVAANTVTITVPVTASGGNIVLDTVSAINTAIGNSSITQVQVLKAFAVGTGSTEHVVIANLDGTDIYVSAVGSSKILAVLGLSTMLGNRLTYANVNVQNSVAGDVWIKTTAIGNGAKWDIKQFNSTTGTWITINAQLYLNDAAALLALGNNVSTGTLYIQYNLSGSATNPSADFQIKMLNGPNNEQTNYQIGETAPVGKTPEGTYWFNTKKYVDIMINNGSKWVGYKNFPGYSNTDPNGVILSASAPLYQTVGTLPLVDNDLWLDTGDTENYPKLYKYATSTKTWTPIDLTDDYSPFGIIFGDARATSTSSLSGATDPTSLLNSNYVDPDSPDPLAYPAGLMLFNTRFSTNNVKEWKPNWFIRQYDSNDYTITGYLSGESGVSGTLFPPVIDAGRWVTQSGSTFGRKAQRNIIVTALGAAINGNEDIVSEQIYFNLIACPGYTEIIPEMTLLNENKKYYAFVVGDSPARLNASGTSILNWTNPSLNLVAADGEAGLLSTDTYLGVYYPWGLGTNLDGTQIMIPPSTMVMSVIAYNDSIAYPWFAPAGFNRGMVKNATSVGYLNTLTNTYTPVYLNQGQRDVLYQNSVNPIAYIPNKGLTVYGQKTRNPIAEATNRVNVVRLVNYLRYNLDNIAKPFLFEQNDRQTRSAVKTTFERFLGSLISLRAITDFLVVCDLTNNSPAQIDNNELWIDVLIIPEKSIEFIYIPIRIENTGTNLSQLVSSISSITTTTAIV